jgi:RNA polymerase sigma factor (sigma-70 family)
VTVVEDGPATGSRSRTRDRAPSIPSSAEALHRAEYVPLLRFLLYQGASWNEAQDATQEAFAALCAPGALAEIAHPRAWLRSAAYRIWLRQDVRSPEAPYPDLLEHQASADEDWHTPLAAVELAEDHRRVLAALQALPPKQRAVMACHLDGFATHEIAAAMNIEPSAVRQNLARARACLKRHLGLAAEGGKEWRKPNEQR